MASARPPVRRPASHAKQYSSRCYLMPSYNMTNRNYQLILNNRKRQIELEEIEQRRKEAARMPKFKRHGSPPPQGSLRSARAKVVQVYEYEKRLRAEASRIRATKRPKRSSFAEFKGLKKEVRSVHFEDSGKARVLPAWLVPEMRRWLGSPAWTKAWTDKMRFSGVSETEAKEWALGIMREELCARDAHEALAAREARIHVEAGERIKWLSSEGQRRVQYERVVNGALTEEEAQQLAWQWRVSHLENIRDRVWAETYVRGCISGFTVWTREDKERFKRMEADFGGTEEGRQRIAERMMREAEDKARANRLKVSQSTQLRGGPGGRRGGRRGGQWYSGRYGGGYGGPGGGPGGGYGGGRGGGHSGAMPPGAIPLGKMPPGIMPPGIMPPELMPPRMMPNGALGGMPGGPPPPGGMPGGLPGGGHGVGHGGGHGGLGGGHGGGHGGRHGGGHGGGPGPPVFSQSEPSNSSQRDKGKGKMTQAMEDQLGATTSNTKSSSGQPNSSSTPESQNADEGSAANQQSAQNSSSDGVDLQQFAAEDWAARAQLGRPGPSAPPQLGQNPPPAGDQASNQASNQDSNLNSLAAEEAAAIAQLGSQPPVPQPAQDAQGHFDLDSFTAEELAANIALGHANPQAGQNPPPAAKFNLNSLTADDWALNQQPGNAPPAAPKFNLNSLTAEEWALSQQVGNPPPQPSGIHYPNLPPALVNPQHSTADGQQARAQLGNQPPQSHERNVQSLNIIISDNWVPDPMDTSLDMPETWGLGISGLDESSLHSAATVNGNAVASGSGAVGRHVHFADLPPVFGGVDDIVE